MVTADTTTPRKARKATSATPLEPFSAAGMVASEEIAHGSFKMASEAMDAVTDAVENSAGDDQSQVLETGASVPRMFETMTDQAGTVAAEAIEPLADAAREAIAAVDETASANMAALDASPFIKLMKGMTMATAFDTSKPQAMLGDMNEKAKGVMEKGAKFAEDFSDFSKGNVEAMVASGRVAAKGVEEMAQYGAEYGRKSMEQATTAMKSFASVKSPTELFQLQSEYAKSAVDAMVTETSKFTESYLKLLGDIAQPLSTRYAMAAEKIKTVTA